jgi:hypothetical protein
MRKRFPIEVSPFVFAFLILAGCASMNKVQPFELAPMVGKLTMAAHLVLVMPENGPVPDDRILEEAFRERPELMGAFYGLPILIKHNKTDVVILVCSPDGQFGWIEDASWTPGVDREWYEIDPKHPAVFTMDPAPDKVAPAD